MGIIMCLVDVRSLENMKIKREYASLGWRLLKLNPICRQCFWKVRCQLDEPYWKAWLAQSVVGLASWNLGDDDITPRPREAFVCRVGAAPLLAVFGMMFALSQTQLDHN